MTVKVDLPALTPFLYIKNQQNTRHKVSGLTATVPAFPLVGAGVAALVVEVGLTEVTMRVVEVGLTEVVC